MKEGRGGWNNHLLARFLPPGNGGTEGGVKTIEDGVVGKIFIKK